ncbi:hypothetical protein [Stieleria magnilauensis]|uniref:DUF7738 domain-containing protein n=1 Tax=Stieleria magnilauensis TaxID=2527963 RepID=A0ABX5XZ79_9BACT|nr:hypothetical protein TBK1r_63750 [Planctomycetes bacterium TBK1r]
MSKFCEVVIDRNAVTINGRSLANAVPIDSFEDFLGKPNRTGSSIGLAYVFGHYGEAHLYDDIGLLMLEHHETALITSIELCGEDPDGIQTTKTPFSGKLTIGGIPIRIGDPVGLLDNSEIHFSTRLPQIPFADVRSSEKGGFTIGVSIRPRGSIRQSTHPRSDGSVAIGSVLLMLHHPSKLDRAGPKDARESPS